MKRNEGKNWFNNLQNDYIFLNSHIFDSPPLMILKRDELQGYIRRCKIPLWRAAFSGLLRRLAMTTHGTVIARYEAIQRNIVET